MYNVDEFSRVRDFLRILSQSMEELTKTPSFSVAEHSSNDGQCREDMAEIENAGNVPRCASLARRDFWWRCLTDVFRDKEGEKIAAFCIFSREDPGV